jgi:hypothetical protein
MEAKYSYETSLEFQRSSRRYIAEDKTLCNHRCENLSSSTRLYDCVVGIEEVGAKLVYPLIRVCLCLTENANIVKKTDPPFRNLFPSYHSAFSSGKLIQSRHHSHCYTPRHSNIGNSSDLIVGFFALDLGLR